MLDGALGAGIPGRTISRSVAGIPAFAKCAAIREPMVPAPKTPTRRIDLIPPHIEYSQPGCHCGYDGSLGSTSVDNGDGKKKKSTQLILVLATNLISLAFLYWALRDSNLSHTGAQLTRLGRWWLGRALVTDSPADLWRAWP